MKFNNCDVHIDTKEELNLAIETMRLSGGYFFAERQGKTVNMKDFFMSALDEAQSKRMAYSIGMCDSEIFYAIGSKKWKLSFDQFKIKYRKYYREVNLNRIGIIS